MVARVANGASTAPPRKRERTDLEGAVEASTWRVCEWRKGAACHCCRHFVAITLGHTIYVRGHLARRPVTLLVHELTHVRQFMERGWIGMTAGYATLWLQSRVRQAPDGSGGT